MSWLSRVRNGIPFLPKRQTAENLWHKCTKCGTMVFVKEWEENYSVCPRCNFHDRIGPAKPVPVDAIHYSPGFMRSTSRREAIPARASSLAMRCGPDSRACVFADTGRRWPGRPCGTGLRFVRCEGCFGGVFIGRSIDAVREA